MPNKPLKFKFIEDDREPEPDIALCSECGGAFHVSKCKTEEEGSWEEGYWTMHVCPKCPDGGCIDDYAMSDRPLYPCDSCRKVLPLETMNTVDTQNLDGEHRTLEVCDDCFLPPTMTKIMLDE